MCGRQPRPGGQYQTGEAGSQEGWQADRWYRRAGYGGGPGDPERESICFGAKEPSLFRGLVQIQGKG